jgi:hypothetical protein
MAPETTGCARRKRSSKKRRLASAISGIRLASDSVAAAMAWPAGLFRKATNDRASHWRSVSMSPVSGKGTCVAARLVIASETRLARSFQRR